MIAYKLVDVIASATVALLARCTRPALFTVHLTEICVLMGSVVAGCGFMSEFREWTGGVLVLTRHDTCSGPREALMFPELCNAAHRVAPLI
jgi:hypothetical protein